jgi:hypothetical protein
MRLSTACKLTVMYVAFTIGALLADIPLLLAHEKPASAPDAIGTAVITEGARDCNRDGGSRCIYSNARTLSDSR